MFATVIGQDLRLLSRDGLALAVLAALFAALVFAVMSAREIAGAHAAGLAQEEAAIWQRQAELEGPVGPTQIRRPATLEPSPLSVLSLGRTRLDPAQAEVSFFARLDLMFRDYQIASPFALHAGAFDLSFVVVVIAPLLMIALGAGMVLSDHDSARLRMMMASQASPATILLARTLLRAGIIIVPIVAAAVIAAHLPAGRPPLADLALWIGAALIYLALWQAVIAFANTLRVRADAASVGLIAMWAVWIFLIPAVTSATAAALHPPPSRAALVAQLRAAEAQGRESAPEDLIRFMHDHPELQAQGEAEIADWMRSNAMIRMRVEQALAGPAQAFETALQSQDAIARLAEFATPALAANRALADTAGTEEARHRAFRRQTQAFKADLQGMLTNAALGARSFTRAEADAAPRFAMDESAVPRNAWSMWFWLGIGALLFAWTARRAGRIMPI